MILPAVTAGTPIHLKTEHLINPLGIDEAAPRFTWQIAPSAVSEEYHTAWIEVFAEQSGVFSSEPVWSSGPVAVKNFLMVYNGPELMPFTRYQWRIKAEGDKTGLEQLVGICVVLKPA